MNNVHVNLSLAQVFTSKFGQVLLVSPVSRCPTILALGYVGAMPAEGIYLLIARVGTIYYFAHFLIVLPLLSRIEKTEPVPLSISEPVLGGMLKPEMARIDRKNV